MYPYWHVKIHHDFSHDYGSNIRKNIFHEKNDIKSLTGVGYIIFKKHRYSYVGPRKNILTESTIIYLLLDEKLCFKILHCNSDRPRNSCLINHK